MRETTCVSTSLGLRATVDYAATAGLSAREHEPRSKAAAEIARDYTFICELAGLSTGRQPDAPISRQADLPTSRQPTSATDRQVHPPTSARASAMARPTDLRQAILEQASGRARAGDEAVAAPEPAAGSASHVRQPGRIRKVSVTGYFRPPVRRQLRRLAAPGDTTVQALLGEAPNDLFAKHGLPELVEPD